MEGMMRFLRSFLVSALPAIVAACAPLAYADNIQPKTFQYVVKSTITVSGASSSDDFEWIGSSGPSSVDVHAYPFGFIPGFTFSLNPEDTVTYVSIGLASSPVFSKTATFGVGSGSPPNMYDPKSIPPTLDTPGNIFAFIEDWERAQVSFRRNSVTVEPGPFMAQMSFTTDVATSGYNWSGDINAAGSVDLDYRLAVYVDYIGPVPETPVPEPSSLLLTGTGILGLVGVMLGKALESCG
jgi:hypothetical protein